MNMVKIKKKKSFFEGRKHSEETKRKMSEARKGNLHPMFGRKHSEEAKEKIRAARVKQVWTDETNKKRSETQKGRVFSEESIEKMRQHALKRFSDKKNHPHTGKKFTKEHIDNISKALKGRRLLDLHSPEKAEEIRSKIKVARAKQVLPLFDSSIEVKIQNFLKHLGIEFLTHQYINIKYAYQCDILIPSMNTVIECDGDYWHGNLDKYGDCRNLTSKQKIQRCLDYERTAQLECEGFKVIRLWENDINKMDVNEFKLQLENHAE